MSVKYLIIILDFPDNSGYNLKVRPILGGQGLETLLLRRLASAVIGAFEAHPRSIRDVASRSVIGEWRRMSKAAAQRPSRNLLSVVSNPRSPEQDSFGDFF